MSGVVDARGSECDGRTTDAEAREPNDPAFGTEKVWTVSSSPTYTTEIVIGILQRYRSGEKEATTWHCSSGWSPLPIRMDLADRRFFFSSRDTITFFSHDRRR